MNNIIKSEITNKKIIQNLYIALIPLLIFGYYKNGILAHNYFIPLLIDLVGFLCGILINVIKKCNILYSSFYPYYGLLIASLMPINCNIYIFAGITFVGLLITSFFKKTNFNVIAAIVLILTLLSNYLGNNFLSTFAYENQHMNSIDYLLGKGSGGINTTCNILCIISFLYLVSKVYYKKEITIYSLISYILPLVLYLLLKGNIANLFKYVFENSLLFIYIFIAPEYMSSPYTSKGKIIYSICIGIFTFGLFLLTPSLAPIGAVLLASIIANVLDKIVKDN